MTTGCDGIVTVGVQGPAGPPGPPGPSGGGWVTYAPLASGGTMANSASSIVQPLDTSTASQTVLAPSTPFDGQQVLFKTGSVGGHSVQVSGSNGYRVDGDYFTMAGSPYEAMLMQFSADVGGWMVVSHYRAGIS